MEPGLSVLRSAVPRQNPYSQVLLMKSSLMKLGFPGPEQVFLHCLQKCTGLIFFIFFFTELLQGFDDPALQLLTQVFCFSVTTIPSSSTFWEISSHLPLDFDLFRLSCELCPASSTAD